MEEVTHFTQNGHFHPISELQFTSDRPRILDAFYTRNKYANVTGLCIYVPSVDIIDNMLEDEVTNIVFIGDQIMCDMVIKKYNIDPNMIYRCDCLKILSNIIKACPKGNYNFLPVYTLKNIFRGFYYGEKNLSYFQPCTIEVANDIMNTLNLPGFKDIDDDCKCIIF